MKIGELAGRTGVNPSAIRFYESLGLLREPHRMGGQRRYADDAVYRVMLIRFAGEMGFALPEVAIFLNGLRDDVPVGARWYKLARRKLAEVERGIERSLKLTPLGSVPYMTSKSGRSSPISLSTSSSGTPPPAKRTE